MVDLATLHTDLATKLGLASRSVSRRIKAKEDATLLSRDIAALVVAYESGMSIKKYGTTAELEEVRAAIAQSSSSTPSDSSSTSSSGTPRAARAVRGAAIGQTQRRRRGKTVFVVHGRNEPLRKAMFAFLRAVGLTPLEWSSALRAIGSGTPTIMEVIEFMLGRSAAIVVLLTPDDLVQLKPELLRKHDRDNERNLVGQARPNVLFEAGIALGSMPKETVLVQIGDVKEFSDVGGIHAMYMNNSSEARNVFAQKLEAANCQVDTSGTDWLTEGDFEQETWSS